MRNKKIGILSYHYVDNYGAVLQVWALRTVLNNLSGINAEIINFIPDDYQIYPYVRDEEGIAAMEGKRARYEKFLIEKCGISEPCINMVSGKGYDCCCVGSDQVWNMRFRENITHEYLFPNLDENVRRFSYAASIGGKIKDEHRKLFFERLSTFNAVSVREESSIIELKKVGFNDAVTVLDPTLLLCDRDYETLIEEPMTKHDNYVFFFSYPIGEDMRKYVPFVNRLALENNLNILHSFPSAPGNLFIRDCGSMMYDGIGQFLWYVKNARVVVTTSYHCAIFGRIFKKPTYIICRETGKERFEQLNRVMDLSGSIVKNDWMKREWNVDDMASYSGDRLEFWRNISLSFLRSVVND